MLLCYFPRFLQIQIPMVTEPVVFFGINFLSINLALYTMNDIPFCTTYIYDLKHDHLVPHLNHIHSVMDIKKKLKKIFEPHFFLNTLHFVMWKQLAITMNKTILHGHFSNGLFCK
jgi:hypothetical protein